MVRAFDGGLSVRIDPSLIKVNEAQELVNVDPDPVVLRSSKSYTSTQISCNDYAAYFDRVWVSSSHERDYVVYEDTLYFTEVGSPTRYYKNGSANLLGIKPPVGSLTYSVATSGSSLEAGPRTYAVTYYNTNTDHESAPLFGSEVQIPANGSVTLSNIPDSQDSQVTHKRLYRIGGNLVGYTQIAEVGASVTSYTDAVADSQATRVLDSVANYPPDDDSRYLTEAYGVFFCMVDNEVRFSKVDDPHSWPPENSFKLRTTGTGILPIPQGLLLFTRNSTYMLRGSDITDFTLTSLSEYQGCLNHQSCQVVKNSPVWVSHDGICTLRNGYVEVISRPHLGRSTFNVAQTVVYDEQYMLLERSGNITVMDLRSGFRFYRLDYTSNVSGLAISEGKLYLVVDGVLCESGTGQQMQLKYVSPVFTEDNHAEIKLYDKVYVRADGTFTVTMFIDGQSVFVQTITGNKTFSLTPPVGKHRGYNCNLTIVGVGTVYTIEFTPTRTQDES